MALRKRRLLGTSDIDMSDEEEPASKRLKSGTMETDAVVDIHAEGDILLVVKAIAGIDKPISIRVSSHALSIGSTVFKRLIGDAPPPPSFDSPKTLQLLDDDGDSLFLLCNILHLRNDALPARLQPTALLAFVRTVVKYNAVVAASRATTPWLDSIYHSKTLQFSDPILIFKLLEAAYLLDDPVYFARFSTRWVQQQTVGQTVDRIAEGSQHGKRLAAGLIARQKDSINALKVDLDLIADACAEALADDNKHYVDCAPGADPTPEDMEDKEDDSEIEICEVDKEAATKYLSALRDANIWPATRWPNSISAIIKLFENFRIPKTDSSDGCHFCIQADVKFATAIGMVKQMHQERLWGLCLDCYKSGGLYEGECRYEHSKGKTVSADAVVRQLSASIQSSRDGQTGRRDTSSSFS